MTVIGFFHHESVTDGRITRVGSQTLFSAVSIRTGSMKRRRGAHFIQIATRARRIRTASDELSLQVVRGSSVSTREYRTNNSTTRRVYFYGVFCFFLTHSFNHLADRKHSRTHHIASYQPPPERGVSIVSRIRCVHSPFSRPQTVRPDGAQLYTTDSRERVSCCGAVLDVAKNNNGPYTMRVYRALAYYTTTTTVETINACSRAGAGVVYGRG